MSRFPILFHLDYTTLCSPVVPLAVPSCHCLIISSKILYLTASPFIFIYCHTTILFIVALQSAHISAYLPRCFGCSLWRIDCFVDHHNYHEDWAKPLTLVILEQLKCCLISFDHIHAFLNLIVFPNLIRVVFFETMSCVLDRFWTFWCHIFIELE